MQKLVVNLNTYLNLNEGRLSTCNELIIKHSQQCYNNIVLQTHVIIVLPQSLLFTIRCKISSKKDMLIYVTVWHSWSAEKIRIFITIKAGNTTSKQKHLSRCLRIFRYGGKYHQGCTAQFLTCIYSWFNCQTGKMERWK